MRYRIVARSVADRRRLLAIGDDGNYYLLTLEGLKPQLEMIGAQEGHELQFSRAWVPALDHTPRTMHDLSLASSFR